MDVLAPGDATPSRLRVDLGYHTVDIDSDSEGEEWLFVVQADDAERCLLDIEIDGGPTYEIETSPGRTSSEIFRHLGLDVGESIDIDLRAFADSLTTIRVEPLSRWSSYAVELMVQGADLHPDLDAGFDGFGSTSGTTLAGGLDALEEPTFLSGIELVNDAEANLGDAGTVAYWDGFSSPHRVFLRVTRTGDADAGFRVDVTGSVYQRIEHLLPPSGYYGSHSGSSVLDSRGRRKVLSVDDMEDELYFRLNVGERLHEVQAVEVAAGDTFSATLERAVRNGADYDGDMGIRLYSLPSMSIIDESVNGTVSVTAGQSELCLGRGHGTRDLRSHGARVLELRRLRELRDGVDGTLFAG